MLKNIKVFKKNADIHGAKGKIIKGVKEMADGINGIFGGGSPYVNGYLAKQNNQAQNEHEENAATVAQNYEQIDPSKVMDFMAANNFFVAPVENKQVGEVDAATQERIGDFMKNFEFVYSLVEKEFGNDLAPMVMDMVMDKLIAQLG